MSARGRVLTPEEAEKKTRFLYWWLLVVIFFEYARPASYFPPLGILPLNSALPLSLMVVTLFAGGLRPVAEIFKDRMARWPLLYLAFILVSMAWSEIMTYAYNVFTLTLGYVFLFWMIVRIVTTEQRLRGMFLVLIISHLFLLAMNPEVVLDPNQRHYILGATFLGDGNDFSLSLCILLPLAMLLALHAVGKASRIFYWTIAAIVLLAIIGTQSRGATLGIAALSGYLWLHSSRKGLGIVVIVLALLVVMIYAPPVYFQRMGTITKYQQDSSAEGRIHAWKAGARMAADNVLGVGAGNFPNSFPKYRSGDAPVRWMTAHSMYFLVLGELGIFGLLVLLKLIIGNARANAELQRAVTSKGTDPPDARYATTILRFTTASMVGFAVAGAFLSVAYYPHIFVMTSLLLSARNILAARCGVDLTELWAPSAKKKPVRARAG
jgi:putative inorganic carbon (hco3(-)) transporter